MISSILTNIKDEDIGTYDLSYDRSDNIHAKYYYAEESRCEVPSKIMINIC